MRVLAFYQQESAALLQVGGSCCCLLCFFLPALSSAGHACHVGAGHSLLPFLLPLYDRCVCLPCCLPAQEVGRMSAEVQPLLDSAAQTQGVGGAQLAAQLDERMEQLLGLIGLTTQLLHVSMARQGLVAAVVWCGLAGLLLTPTLPPAARAAEHEGHSQGGQ